MRILSILWRVLVNLVGAVVILAMFHIAKSSFETVIISGLVLIYTSVNGSYYVLGYALHKKWSQDSWRFLQIGKSLNISQTEIVEEALKEDEKETSSSQVPFWINVGFNTLFTLIAIGNLLYAVAT